MQGLNTESNHCQQELTIGRLWENFSCQDNYTLVSKAKYPNNNMNNSRRIKNVEAFLLGIFFSREVRCSSGVLHSPFYQTLKPALFQRDRQIDIRTGRQITFEGGVLVIEGGEEEDDPAGGERESAGWLVENSREVQQEQGPPQPLFSDAKTHWRTQTLFFFFSFFYFFSCFTLMFSLTVYQMDRQIGRLI